MESIDDLVLGQMLLDRGMVAPARLEEARADAARLEQPLADVLLAAKLVRREDLDALAGQNRFKEALKSFDEGFKKTPELRKLIGQTYQDLKLKVTD